MFSTTVQQAADGAVIRLHTLPSVLTRISQHMEKKKTAVRKQVVCFIYAVQQVTQSVLMSEFIQHLCYLDMFRTSWVHHQKRFVQIVFADLVCGNTRTTRHVQPL